MSSDDESGEVEAPMEEWTWTHHKDRGNAEFGAGRFENAAKYYTDAIELHQTEPSLYSNRAITLIKMKQFAKALADAKKALEIDRHFVKGYSRAAVAACNLGNFEEGLRFFKEGAVMAYGTPAERELEEGVRNCQLALRAKEAAVAALEKKDYAAALRHLAPCSDVFPDCFDLMVLRAAARATTNPTGALGDLNPFACTHGEHPEFLYVRALATYHGSGTTGTKNAQSILKSALELDPENEKCKVLFRKVRALDRLREEGNAAFKERRWSDAVEKYSAAMDEDLSNKLLLGLLAGNRAAARLEMKDLQGALRDCHTAIQYGNDAAKIYARRARIHERLELYDDALKDIERAAELDPSFRSELEEIKVVVKRSKRKNYYKILGLERTADDRDIKKAYRNKALEYHPDKWAHCSEEEKKTAEARFKEIGEAVSVLSDPKKRAMYDNGQLDNDVEGAQGGPGGGGMPADMDMMNIFNMMFAGGGMGDFGGMGGMPGMGRRRGRGHGSFGGRGGFPFYFLDLARRQHVGTQHGSLVIATSHQSQFAGVSLGLSQDPRRSKSVDAQWGELFVESSRLPLGAAVSIGAAVRCEQ